MMGEKEMSKYWLPWLVGMPAESARAICSLMFGGVFKKFPKLKFCFAHGGGSFPHTVGRVEHGYNCRPDLTQVNLQGPDESPLKWLGHFWVDSLVHSPEAFTFLVKIIGQNRIVLGTDYPFPLGECYPLKSCGELVEGYGPFSHKDKKQVLWYNALEFIGKDESVFLKKSQTDTKLEPQTLQTESQNTGDAKPIANEKQDISENKVVTEEKTTE
ncbi:aminocarboxymuconate-semialdehyde decarboxylase [Reticulomyxa filosa]|uniref:2-amino-3-carboxymuconate-6-semialdehyde decarboxylase n=1 Tax=Reticulomyxa filosa TaxID=46433 RepID=X6M8A9_RETFI|nr:aminocarboxymuconate-semialdehyde decarboxylase [Reticulomyxa filosa]|eukprot:ETO10223.1 aminocarboxymuconate-semialdehyde decarboxylase [Reticulomyxa filosa]